MSNFSTLKVCARATRGVARPTAERAATVMRMCLVMRGLVNGCEARNVCRPPASENRNCRRTNITRGLQGEPSKTKHYHGTHGLDRGPRRARDVQNVPCSSVDHVPAPCVP